MQQYISQFEGIRFGKFILATLEAKNSKNRQLHIYFVNNSVNRPSLKNLYDPVLINGP